VTLLLCGAGSCAILQAVVLSMFMALADHHAARPVLQTPPRTFSSAAVRCCVHVNFMLLQVCG
jgi:hypothetical protein